MRKLVFGLLFAFSTSLFAQEWQKDMGIAQDLAQKEGKIIVLVFQGSDWCAPCIKLDKEIFSTEVFKEYAKSNYVMLQADFPRKRKNKLGAEQKEKNARLFERYNKRGVFPYVVVLDANKKVLNTAGYKRMTPKEYIEYLNSY